jgi:hypothetical protein
VLDLGAGFLLIKSGDSSQVMHKSGLLPPITKVSGARIIHHAFLAIHRETHWALYSLTGKPLTGFLFQRIEPIGHFVLLGRAGKSLLLPLHQILPYTRGTFQPIVADEIKLMGDMFWMRNGFLEQVIDKNLQTVIPFDRHQISYTALGFMIKQGGLTTLPQWSIAPEKLESVTIAEPWAILRATGERPVLHHIPTKKIMELTADSIWFAQGLAFTRVRDSIRLRLPNLQTINLAAQDDMRVKMAKDSTLFLLVRDKSKTRVILAKTFREVFRTSHWPDPITANIFLFDSKGKKGLLDNKGKEILAPVYDAIVFNQATLSLLKNNAFGAFNITTKKIIKPTYESNLRAIGTRHFTVRKKTGWGFIADDGKPISKFIYDDIQPWTDSIALVEQNNRKTLLTINTQQILIDSLDQITFIGSDQEKYALVERNKMLTVINSKGKLALPAWYEELATLSLDSEKLILTIASVSNNRKQVSYWKLNGTLIYSFQTSTDIALKLLCD